jgi:glycosyltransferase involved in cell wall biosynthesis
MSKNGIAKPPPNFLVCVLLIRLINEETGRTIISILVVSPIRNESEYLNRMILSLVRQSYRSWKLLVVDNSSIDSSVKIARDWEKIDSRVSVVSFSEAVSVHENFSRAFNLALSEFDSEYVQILAGDDYIVESQYFETALGVLRDINVDFVIGHVKDGAENQSTEARFSFLNSSLSNREKHQFACDNYWTCHLLYALYRRSVFERLVKHKLSKFTKNLSSDWWFSFQALTNFRGRYSTKITYGKHMKKLDYNSEHYRARKSFSFISWMRKIAFPVFQLGDRILVLRFSDSVWFLRQFIKRELKTAVGQLRLR